MGYQGARLAGQMATKLLPLLAAVLWALLAFPSRAEEPPPHQPILRIDGGNHTAIIRRLAVSDDGTVLVTGSEDKTIRVWSLPDGALLKTLRPPVGPGDDGKIFSVALSPDGKLVAAGGWDHSTGDDLFYHVYVFNRVTGAILKRLGPNPNVANDLAFSPDGSRLAAGFGLLGVKSWRVSDWSVIGADTDYDGGVYGVAFNRKNDLAATSRDGLIRLYDAEMTLVSREPAPSGAQPDGIAFAPDGYHLAIGYADTTKVDILLTPALRQIGWADTQGVDYGDLGAVAWSDDGQTLFAAGGYNTPDERMPLFAWDKAGRGARVSTDGAGDTIMDLQPVKGGGVALAAADHSFTVFDTKGDIVLRRKGAAADMRGKIGTGFMVSGDGMRVRFGLGVQEREPWLFDMKLFKFEASPTAPSDVHAPDVTALNVENWDSADRPAVNGTPLSLENNETSRALAIAGNAKDLYLGTDWALRRYRADGEPVWQIEVPEVTWGVNVADHDRIVVAAHVDGTVRWYRAEDGAELLALFVNAEDKSWIAWTPKGYYAASAGGEDLMGWQVNRSWTEAPDFFPAAQFHERFYRPDIVRQVLLTRDEDSAIKAANEAARRSEKSEAIADALPPVIEIVDPAPGAQVTDRVVTFRYRVRTPSGEKPDSVDVLIDGRPAGTRGAAVVSEDNDVDAIDVTIPARDVEVSLVASLGDRVSVPARVKLIWAGPPSEETIKRRLFAVFVGISKYDRQDLELGFADADARDFAEEAAAQQGLLYEKVETRLLVDGEASADNIRAALSWLEEKVGPDDVGLLFLAGHGVTDAKQRFYFLPVGGDPAKLRSTAISESEIREAISTLPGKTLFFIDACHAAASLDRNEGDVDVTSIVNRMARADSGVIMFASSQGRELSLESSEWKHGAFTAVLLKGVEGGADYEKDGAITTAELNLWLSSKVKELTQDRQTAVMLKPDTVPDFAVARLAR
jgi:WD40 repeat protein